VQGPAAAGGSEHLAPLLALGIAPQAASALAAYLDRLARWSERVNLTGVRGASERVAVLVGPALPLARALVPGPLIDVGSGNGSPGLVLALLEPERAVTLLEPRARRWAFLREACRCAGRPDVRVLRERHDGYSGPRAANVVLRALRLAPRDLVPLLLPGGRVLFVGRRVEAPAGFRGLPGLVAGGCVLERCE
jgi:16S rRNA (guanine527-N7)-methyltransferase